MRRAMSIENCEPKSMTTTDSGWRGTGGAVSAGASPDFSRASPRYVETSTSPEARKRELCVSGMSYPVMNEGGGCSVAVAGCDDQCTAHRHKRLDINDQYREAVEVLRQGGIVALPT